MKKKKTIKKWLKATKEALKELPLKQKIELLGFTTTPVVPPIGMLSGIAYLIDEHMRVVKENESLKKKLEEVV